MASSQPRGRVGGGDGIGGGRAREEWERQGKESETKSLEPRLHCITVLLTLSAVMKVCHKFTITTSRHFQLSVFSQHGKGRLAHILDLLALSVACCCTLKISSCRYTKGGGGSPSVPHDVLQHDKLAKRHTSSSRRETGNVACMPIRAGESPPSAPVVSGTLWEEVSRQATNFNPGKGLEMPCDLKLRAVIRPGERGAGVQM